MRCSGRHETRKTVAKKQLISNIAFCKEDGKRVSLQEEDERQKKMYIACRKTNLIPAMTYRLLLCFFACSLQASVPDVNNTNELVGALSSCDYGAVKRLLEVPNEGRDAKKKLVKRAKKALMKEFPELQGDFLLYYWVFKKGRNPNMVKLLAHHSSNIDIQDGKHGKSALHWIAGAQDLAEEDKSTLVDILVNKDANIYLKDNQGKTPVDLLKETEATEVLKRITERRPPPSEDTFLASPLTWLDEKKFPIGIGIAFFAIFSLMIWGVVTLISNDEDDIDDWQREAFF